MECSDDQGKVHSLDTVSGSYHGTLVFQNVKQIVELILLFQTQQRNEALVGKTYEMDVCLQQSVPRSDTKYMYELQANLKHMSAPSLKFLLPFLRDFKPPGSDSSTGHYFFSITLTRRSSAGNLITETLQLHTGEIQEVVNNSRVVLAASNSDSQICCTFLCSSATHKFLSILLGTYFSLLRHSYRQRVCVTFKSSVMENCVLKTSNEISVFERTIPNHSSVGPSSFSGIYAFVDKLLFPEFTAVCPEVFTYDDIPFRLSVAIAFGNNTLNPRMLLFLYGPFGLPIINKIDSLKLKFSDIVYPKRCGFDRILTGDNKTSDNVGLPFSGWNIKWKKLKRGSIALLLFLDPAEKLIEFESQVKCLKLLQANAVRLIKSKTIIIKRFLGGALHEALRNSDADNVQYMKSCALTASCISDIFRNSCNNLFRETCLSLMHCQQYNFEDCVLNVLLDCGKPQSNQSLFDEPEDDDWTTLENGF